MIGDVKGLIEARLAELQAEEGKLERALTQLAKTGGDSRNTGVPRSSTQRSSGPKRAGTRARRGQRREQLMAAIKERPGARAAELARSIGISDSQIHSLIRKARSDKLIVKKGRGYAVKA